MSIEESVILLACQKGPQHGYNIYRQIIADTTGRVYIRPATTYRLLKKMAANGLLEAIEHPDITRKTYTITHTGKEMLEYQSVLYRGLNRTIIERLRA